MNFSEALQALKDGKRIKREIWGGYWFLAGSVQAEHDPVSYGKDGERSSFYMYKMIVAVLAGNGGLAPAQPYQSDLLAEDWMIVE
jgi:hypothetical protein